MTTFTDKQKKQFVEYYNELCKQDVKPTIEHFQRYFGFIFGVAYDALVTARFEIYVQKCGGLVTAIQEYNNNNRRTKK